MTRMPAMLAASARPLSDVLVDSLRRAAKPRPEGDEDGVAADADRAEQLRLRFDDEEFAQADAGDEGADEQDALSALPPDEIAAAVLLGRALNRHRSVLGKLRDRDTIAIIEVCAPEYFVMMKRLLRVHVLGPDTQILEGSKIEGSTLVLPGAVALFVGWDDGKTGKSPPENGRFAAAIQRRCAIIGLATDPERQLPAELILLAGDRIVVPPLDGAAVAAVIETATGRHPGPVDDALAQRVTRSTLNAAVRADLGAERSLERLRLLVVGDKCASADPTPTLSELHGLGAARDWGLALVRDLKDYAAGRLPWSAVDRGCLLTGVPGTGKTTFARTIAKEAGVHFVATSYAQWQAHREGHLGHVTQAIRNAFAEAQKNRPAILFIDEIDTIPARGTGKWNDDWWTSITNALLECMDGFERREGIVVIGACNDPSRLDPALVRSGRLDRHIDIPLPDVPALVGILRTHLGDELASADLRIVALAARGHTGADVERWVRDARRLARRNGRGLTLQDLLKVIRGGAPEWPTDVRRRVAYHEAGHAIAATALGIAEPVALSIGGDGGLAENERGEARARTRAYLENFLVVLLAGRASEQLIFGEPTAGAGGADGSDLAKVTRLALSLETVYGLGSLGMVWIGDDATERHLLLDDALRAAVRRTIDEAFAHTLDLLSKHRRALDALATALFEKAYLDRDEIHAVLAQHPLVNVGARGASFHSGHVREAPTASEPFSSREPAAPDAVQTPPGSPAMPATPDDPEPTITKNRWRGGNVRRLRTTVGHLLAHREQNPRN